MTTIDYSVWDHIEVSDDEDDTHPNIDTPSLFRWRHQARVERMEVFMKKGEELEKSLMESRRKLAEAQRRVQELVSASTPEAKADLAKVQEEEKQLKKQERSWEKKLQEHRIEEKKMPWNVDTLSKEGFSKSVVNVKPEKEEETEEEKEEKHKTFVEKYEKQIKHFGSDINTSDHTPCKHICETHLDHSVLTHLHTHTHTHTHTLALMEQVAHQTIVMQFILELSKSLKVDPRGCFRQFFTKIKTADQQYQDAFNDELESFKERVRGRAKIRIEKALKEYEEEERQKRMGPGGLDPVEVYESLPASDDLPLLQEAKHHMKRCIESGLWVPNARADEEGEKDKEEGDEPQYEEVKKEEQ
uniref:Hsp90 co-chaperone Cdc37 n=1 Tax=Sinocyclocheilus rhinocerous TaxID=307959 RepID=A0A673H2N1_9TELE